LRRIAANHGDNALLLLRIEQTSSPGSRLVVEGTLQSFLLISAEEIPDSLGRERNYLGHLRGTGSGGQLQQRQSAQYYPDRLNATAQELLQLGAVLLGECDA